MKPVRTGKLVQVLRDSKLSRFVTRPITWLMVGLLALTMTMAFALPPGVSPQASRESAPPTAWTAEAALAELRDGNARFVKSARIRSTDTMHDAESRRRVAKEQHPFATVLCCSDSRVCPEFIFDQSPGSFFELRNAGNVVDESMLASVEYAIEHLHVSLLLVLGHTGCGAIKAVCEAEDLPLPEHLQDLQKRMTGVREQLREAHGERSPAMLDRLSKENARQQALRLLQESRVLRASAERGDVRIVYGLYDLESGVVDVFKLD